jgi:hypothetical protein
MVLMMTIISRSQFADVRHVTRYVLVLVTGRYTTCYGTVPPCSALFEYVLFSPSTYLYVLFTPCTYQVRIFEYSTYSVRTEYRNHDKSTYLTLKLQTFRVTYQYVPTLLLPSTYCFAYSCTTFLLFLKGTYSVHSTDSR